MCLTSIVDGLTEPEAEAGEAIEGIAERNREVRECRRNRSLTTSDSLVSMQVFSLDSPATKSLWRKGLVRFKQSP